MTRVYSYVLRFDDGAAPNPFWGICTLTICKPAIRRTAQVGDWVIGTGSKNSKLKDGKTHNLSHCIVYAMKITDKKSLADYDDYCCKNFQEKIPDWYNQDWKKRMGDCIYDFSNSSVPKLRKGVHSETNRERDMRGENALLSNHFYYFGEEVKRIPNNIKKIIKRNQGHLKIERQDIIEKFEKWIIQFEKNKIYANPQLKYEFDQAPTDDQILKCSVRHKEEDTNEKEKVIC